MDCVCLRKKHRKKRQEPKFRHMSQPVSPAHSQPSSLGNNPDARLPKVNSTGLWMGTPSMYTGGPASAYYLGRGVPVSSHIQGDPRLVPRASSDPRLSQNVPSQGGQRIFHSSQQLTPLYEVPVRNGNPMDIYDVYQFGGVSKSKMAETKHTRSYYEGDFIYASKLERSKSDVGEKTKHSRRSSEKSKPPAHQSHSSSNDGNWYRTRSRDDIHRTSEHGSSSRGSKSASSVKQGRPVSREDSHRSSSSGQNNRAFSDEADMGRVSSIKEETPLKPSMISTSQATAPVPTSSVATVAGHSPPLINGTPGLVSTFVEDRNKINSSATDSMKLLAKNKTDDQKTIVPQTSDLISENNPKNNDANGTNFGHQHYIYQGDIYAVSENRKFIDGDEEENPIIARMKDMVIEKSRHSNPPPSTQQAQDTPPIIYSVIQNGGGSDNRNGNNSPIYAEIITEKREIKRQDIAVTVSENVLNEEQPDKPKTTKLASLADLSALDGIEIPRASDVVDHPGLDRNAYSKSFVNRNKTNSIETEEISQPTSPIAMREKSNVSQRNDEVEGASEEISTAGNRITDSAFEFLNTYLSDDEGTDVPIDSPPLSPTS